MAIRFLLLLLLATTTVVQAQTTKYDEFEVGGLAFSYDAGIAPWRGAVVRTQIVRGPRFIWSGELVAEQRFRETSFAYKAQHAADFGGWITRVAVATSSGGFYNPRFHVDGHIGRKLFRSRRLIATLGGFYRNVRDGHQDSGVVSELQWYAASRMILQAGIRFQQSNPGNAWSRYQDMAITVGRAGKRTFVLAAGAGSEAYQIIDPLVIYTDFESANVQLTWREWVGGRAGFAITGSYYSNPFYSRSGVQASIFFRPGS